MADALDPVLYHREQTVDVDLFLGLHIHAAFRHCRNGETQAVSDPVAGFCSSVVELVGYVRGTGAAKLPPWNL